MSAAVIVEALGWVGSVLLVISLLQTRVRRLRWINLVSCAVLILYNAWIASWPMVAVNVVLVVVNAVNLLRLAREAEDAA